jgi:hypothetical protein
MKKTAEQLTNVELDFLAAKALGYDCFIRTSQSRKYPHVWVKHKGIFSPTTNPEHMLLIQEMAKISIQAPIGENIYWIAYINGDKIINPGERREIVAKKSSFKLIDAVARCFIAFMYGDMTDVEEIKLSERVS